MSDVLNVSEMFGKNVFNDAVMRDRLPKSVYKKLKKTIEDGAELDPSIADVVAHAMKDWAIESKDQRLQKQRSRSCLRS